jgi:hypothetical protein
LFNQSANSPDARLLVDNLCVTSASVDQEQATTPLQSPSATSRLDWALVGALVVVLGLLYAWQLQPGIAPHGDISKFQFAGPLGGTAHQTGYPLYLMITWLAAHTLPLIDAATATTAVSAVFGVAAAVMTYVALRELHARPAVAATFSLLLGVAPVIFYYAVVAEVYSAHMFFMAAVLAMLLRWRHTGSDVDLGGAIVVLALSFSHHMGMALLAPGILWFVWKTDRRTFRRLGVWLFGLGSLLVTALLYGYLIWRANDPATPFVEVAPESWLDIPAIWIGTGGATLVVGPDALLQRIPGFSLRVARSALLAVPLAIVGFRALRRDAAITMLALWGVASALFALLYAAPDPQSFIPPVVFVLVVVAGVGTEWIAVRYVTSTSVAVAALVSIAAVGIAGGVRFVDFQSPDEYAQRTRTWVAELPPNSVLAASYTDTMAAFHLALLEGTRTDVATISDYPPADPEGSVIGRYLAGEPVEVPHTRVNLMPGRPVYAPGQAWACDLAGAGFGIEPYTEYLFRVLPLGDSAHPDVPELCGAST